MNNTAIVIGAGIVGLATAKALAEKGFKVTVFERTAFAVGASVRNFGMVWPIGQPGGKLYDRAIRSRTIWQELSAKKVFWSDPVGSIHLAYHDDEMQVLNELLSIYGFSRNLELLTPEEVCSRSEAVVRTNLKGGLFSPYETIVNPVEAIRNIPAYLEETASVSFHWNTVVSKVSSNKVTAGNREYEADLVFVCSGMDFETLYPDQFSSLEITKCKLQMMRLVAQPENWRIGPALCGGLSLTHYKGFAAAPSVELLKKRFDGSMQQYVEWGIHVMVSQNGNGELTIGDSHEYARTFDPFDKQFINDLILTYLRSFAQFKDWTLLESWNGIYARMTNGATECVLSPEEGVHIINGLGGAGMTLSFGLAEEVVASL